MNTDPIADCLTRIRNASKVGHATTVAPYSKIKEGVCRVLKDNNFIDNYKIQDSGKFKEILITVKPTKVIQHSFKRVSKPGQRIYLKSKEIKNVRSGLGIQVMSTSKGIMTGREARKQNLGGEVICEVF